MRILIFILIVWISSLGCGDSNQNKIRYVNFPDSVLVSRFSPDSAFKASLFYWRDGQANFLTPDRWILGLSNESTDWFISRELGEGKGTYEGGVFDIKWISNDQILIDRRIDDQEADLIFNVVTHTFQKAEE